MWAEWEKKDKGWQKKVVNYGNHAFRRIPYEEWGLKSVPPLSTKRREEELRRTDRVQLVYPETVIPTAKSISVLETLATERESLHRSRLIWCFVGMPITIPVGILPVIPNLPFFYLAYRAWSHWRALAGGKHIQFLTSNNLVSPTLSPILDAIYRQVQPSKLGQPSDPEASAHDSMLLSQETGRRLVEALDIPELEVEIERAIWQVERAIERAQEQQSK